MVSHVKEEPFEVSFTENDDHEVIDDSFSVQNNQSSRFLQENSTVRLQKFNKTHENEHDEIDIEFECKEEKLKMNSLLLKKIDDYSQNYLQDIKYSRIGDTENNIKIEIVGEVKKELFEDDEKKLITNVEQDFGKENESRTNIDTMRKSVIYPCHKCEKIFRHQGSLINHTNSEHKGVKYSCNICEKTFRHKGSLKTHMNSAHKGVKYACNICGKTFTQGHYLKTHINLVHNGIIVANTCDLCGKKFSWKNNFTRHINTMHNGIFHACNICGMKSTTKSHLKTHIDAVHDGVTHTCDVCGKKFLYKCNLNRHVKSSHHINSKST
ncbi:zinc finger protein 33A-like [Trichogramma pretiosum]|uniref:zinc finger protein 33A-like n=1 Tax=Trichogramma pretiosum TaxID=7493 RepID=UPI0006C9D8D2|nr:zinc finger protein 33A-like [Trichogramma pretiosum]